ncbi:acyl-CoA dehydrogenase family protein [Nonomuraea sediminis]|uniref:acyl-CoA dehydrogenase family protein n=1 Tax=Nonomuraea sediminis TaxID=2835864 RepID=UPI001BDC581C|nr:acyl-CoA dehydrogenase family protein [Nonomuraea sediminis]
MIREWLHENWDPELSLREWRERLADSGWGAPTWPREWCGRGLPPAAAQEVTEEFRRIGAVGPADGLGMHLAAPTVLAHGSDDLKRRFVRPTLTGEIHWCQLFSEPGSGSDLAGLRTRAHLDGDTWVISGQKVWNTSAHHADYGMLLARTDWDAPKHRGLTYFVLPMRQAGVEVRPLRQMNGHASFNEVFFEEARVPAANAVGAVNDGWTVALTTLAHERRMVDLGRRAVAGPDAGRCRREAAEESARAMEPYRWYPQRAGRPDLVIERAIASGRHTDPVVRQEIVKLITLVWTARWTSQRAAAARAAGRPPGPEGSLAKLASSDIARAAARVHALIAGPSGMLAGSDAPLGGTIAEVFLSVPAASLAGGTDEIQRTIIGERVLGLPKEPVVDRDVPFREIRGNAR